MAKKIPSETDLTDPKEENEKEKEQEVPQQPNPSSSKPDDKSSGLPRLELDQPIPASVLSRRRCGISGSGRIPTLSMPNMKRRGAVSYDPFDESAVYIRNLSKRMLATLERFTFLL